jgi:hypothetical protein
LYPAIPAKHEDEREEFLLPCEGEVKDDWKHPEAECGKTKIVRDCGKDSNCDYPKELIPWDCTRLLCPVDGKRALKRAANKSKTHIWATLSELKMLVPWIAWMLSSVIISVPPELWYLEFDDLKRMFRKSLKVLGTENVAAILHLWRFREKATGKEVEPNSVSWKKYEKNPEAFERVLSPHFHCLVLGKMVTSSKYYKDSGGWVYKKKGDRLNKKDVYRIVYYALSHASISTTKRRQYVAYYGLFNSLKEIDDEKHIDFEPIMCPKCNKQRVDRTVYHRWVAGVDTFGLEVPAVKMIVHRKFAFREKWQRWVPAVKFRDLDGGLDFSGYDAPVKEVEVVDLDDM